MKLARFLACSALFGVLAACNTPQQPAPQAAAYAQPVYQEESASGSGECGRQISHLRKIIDSDLQTGNLEQKVYNRMHPEVEHAAAACRAGKNGEALGMLAATKHRFGYR